MTNASKLRVMRMILFLVWLVVKKTIKHSNGFLGTDGSRKGLTGTKCKTFEEKMFAKFIPEEL